MYDVTEIAHVSINWDVDAHGIPGKTMLGTEAVDGRKPTTAVPSTVISSSF